MPISCIWCTSESWVGVASIIHFLYLKTLGKDWNIESIPFAKQPKKVPLVLSQDEVRAVLEAITNPQNRVIAMILYAVWRDNQDENRATIRMRIDVATRPRVT